MKHDKHKHLALILVAAAILVTVNAGVWLAAQHGAIAPIGNLILWAAFAVLNVVSLVWAISLLGLHPLVVALSYVAGGFLAFKGIQGVDGLGVAEITTAGATYGAFGTLAVCNCTTKIRYAFFSKGQAPFIFIIAALLVFDAVLNSGIVGADGNVMLNVVVFPFVLAGVIVGFIWSVLARYGIGKTSVPEPQAVASEQLADVKEDVKEKEESNTLRIQIPVHVELEEEADAVAAVAEAAELSEEVVLPDEEPVKAVMEQQEKIVEPEEHFFPLEIDKDNDFIIPEDAEIHETIETAAELDPLLDEDLYSSMNFDTNLYDSDANDEDRGAVMVEEPIVSMSLDINEEVGIDPEETLVEHVKPESVEETVVLVEAEPVPLAKPEPVAEPIAHAEEVEPVSQVESESVEEPIAQAESEPVAQVKAESAEEPVAHTEAAPVSQGMPEPEVEPIVQAEPIKKAKTDDWLSGHLDLLNKLK